MNGQDETDTVNNNQKDTKPAKGKNGGRRPGAGRPRGSLSVLNKQRQAAKKQFITRVNKMVDQLFNAQASIAQGVSYLYRIDKDSKGNDLPAELVTSEDEIRQYIDGTLDGDAYYYIHTERPDNKAIVNMLDRAFGKPEEKIDITSDGKRIEQPAIISPIAPRKTEDDAAT